MNREHRIFRLLFTTFLLVAFLQSCDDQIEPNITPMAELVFEVADEDGNPIAGAIVYLFPFQTSYNEYKDGNRDGLSNTPPNVAVENVATSDATGRVFFPARDLQGNGFASGNSWVYRPNPIYARIEASHQGNFLTNDDDSQSTRIAFDELASGDVITVTTPVTLK